MKTKLISKCQKGQGIKNQGASRFKKLGDIIKNNIQSAAKTITTWGNIAIEHPVLDEYGKPIMQADKTPVKVTTSPAQNAATLSAVGHIVNQGAESIPIIGQLPTTQLVTNAIDVATTIPDAFFDVTAWAANPSIRNAHSILVDIPEIFPGYADDVVSWEGFADDLKQATNGKINVTGYDNTQKIYKKLIQKPRKKN